MYVQRANSFLIFFQCYLLLVIQLFFAFKSIFGLLLVSTTTTTTTTTTNAAAAAAAAATTSTTTTSY